MTLSIERADRRMGLASDRTVYSSKRNRPLLLYGRLLDDSRPSHGLTATNPDYFLFADHPAAMRVRANRNSAGYQASTHSDYSSLSTAFRNALTDVLAAWAAAGSYASRGPCTSLAS